MASPANVQEAVPPGTFVKLAPRSSSAARLSPCAPVTEPVAPCAAPSYTAE